MPRKPLVPVLALLVLGCGRGQEKVIPIPAGDPLRNARTVLQRYAEGQMMASEVESFDDLVASVRKVDPERADVLDKGLKEIKANPSGRATIAKGLLPKLQPQTR